MLVQQLVFTFTIRSLSLRSHHDKIPELCAFLLCVWEADPEESKQKIAQRISFSEVLSVPPSLGRIVKGDVTIR
jgi:hypothetical protein